MKTLVHAAVKMLVVLAVLVPVSAMLTILLVPFWRWLEASTGIESIGHSGPSDWCFALVYAVLFLVFLVMRWALRRGRGARAGEA